MILFENRKIQRKKLKSKSVRLEFLRCGGTFALQALENGLLRSDQLEALRRTLVKHTDRKARIIILIKPNINITSKPVGVRMGKGKGDIKDCVFKVMPGQLIVEIIYGNNQGLDIFGALHKARLKLPILTKVIKRLL